MLLSLHLHFFETSTNVSLLLVTAKLTCRQCTLQSIDAWILLFFYLARHFLIMKVIAALS